MFYIKLIPFSKMQIFGIMIWSEKHSGNSKAKTGCKEMNSYCTAQIDHVKQTINDVAIQLKMIEGPADSTCRPMLTDN